MVKPTGDVFAHRSTDLAKLITGSKVLSIESGNYLPHNEPVKFAEAIMEFVHSLNP